MINKRINIYTYGFYACKITQYFELLFSALIFHIRYKSITAHNIMQWPSALSVLILHIFAECFSNQNLLSQIFMQKLF